MRLDKLLVENYDIESRNKAQTLIEEGNVFVNGNVITKPNFDCKENDLITIKGAIEYVSRGAYKLKAACEKFKINMVNRVVLDIGASTGGFTDYCVKNGASRVFAVDVGTDQLHQSLVENDKVLNMEKVNAKDLKEDDFEISPNLVVADLSFISLTHVIPVIKKVVPQNTEMVFLIKPQFELTKEELDTNKGKVVDPKQHTVAIERIRTCAKDNGLRELGFMESPIKGDKLGNTEFVIWLK